MGLQKKDASKANIATENAGNLPNLLSVQRQSNGADKTISIPNTRSLSLWRTLAKEKKTGGVSATTFREAARQYQRDNFVSCNGAATRKGMASQRSRLIGG